MTTELPVELQPFTDKDKPTNAGMTEEFKDQPSNDMSTKNDLASAAMRDMDDNDKYEFNYRLVVLFPFTLIIFVSYNAEYTYTNNNVSRIVNILITVYHSFLILFGFAIFIFCTIYKKPFTKFVNALFGFVSSNRFGNAANGNVSDVFEFEQRQYAGLWLFVSIMYSSAVTILDVTYDLYTRDLDLRLPVHTRLIPLVLNLTFFTFYKTVKCHQKINEEKKSVLAKYTNTEKMANKIEKRLRVWQQSKRLTNRRKECIAICLFIVFWHYFSTVIIDWEIYKHHDPQTAVLITIVFVFNIPFLVFIVYWMNTVYLHFKFPSIIMAELAAPINAETMDDLIGWWQLRDFYAQCIVKLYISSFGVYIAALIFGSIMAVIAAFFSIVDSVDFDIETVLIVVVLCYVLSITLLLVSNAANYHSIQLSHVNMLRVECIALRKYNADNIDSINDSYGIELSQYENDMQHYVINELKQDVENNSDIINVLGISINSNFMLLLRAASGSVAVAIISILFS